MTRPPRALGVDTGGTFTDLMVDTGRGLRAMKLPSTPAAPELAVLAGLRQAGATRATAVRHGSTVATNALLERKGARVALVTTAGFEDVLEIGRQDRPDLYALHPVVPPPLVGRQGRLGVRERIGAAGEIAVPLTAREVLRIVRRVRAMSPEAVAVGLIHAWAHPAHERRLARALAELGLPISVSSALAPEIREYERISTTVANAFLEPRVRRYMETLARAHRGDFEVVLSHGGTAPPREAGREPVRQLLSGPAAGLRAALKAARACGHRVALSLDVGGTSTDCALLGAEDAGADGLPRSRRREVAGVPILLPALDVHTVGAGGGSIVRVDAQGLLHVGPESAGASPGPACYGRGGPATVTDALLVLGRLPMEALAGGAVPLDRGAAERALGAIARRLGTDGAAAAAEAVVALADAHMERALRRVSVEQGEDPRTAVLVAFGGAGGLHACALADALDLRAVVWPRHAGVLCAYGALAGGTRRERSRSILAPASEVPRLASALVTLERQVRAGFAGRVRRRLHCEAWAEVRYRGQAHELALPALPLESLARRFHAAHVRRFGFADHDRAVEVVTLEVRGALADRTVRDPLPRRGKRAPGASTRVRCDGRDRPARVHRRDALPVGASVAGPAVVCDEGATLWIAPGWKARVHASGALLLRRAGS